MTKDKTKKNPPKADKKEKKVIKTKPAAAKTPASIKIPADKPTKKIEAKVEAKTDFDKSTLYPITDAIKLTKELGKEKFDASIEVHFNLSIDPKKRRSTD